PAPTQKRREKVPRSGGTRGFSRAADGLRTRPTYNRAVAKSVLLTGAGGFLAGHFASAFAGAGWAVAGAGRAEVSDPDRLRALIDRGEPDVLVHLAGPASVPQSFADPRADFLGAMLPAIHVLESVRQAG